MVWYPSALDSCLYAPIHLLIFYPYHSKTALDFVHLDLPKEKRMKKGPDKWSTSKKEWAKLQRIKIYVRHQKELFHNTPMLNDPACLIMPWRQTDRYLGRFQIPACWGWFLEATIGLGQQESRPTWLSWNVSCTALVRLQLVIHSLARLVFLKLSPMSLDVCPKYIASWNLWFP